MPSVSAPFSISFMLPVPLASVPALSLIHILRAGQKIGPRMYCSGTAITVPGGHGDGTFAETASDPALYQEEGDLDAVFGRYPKNKG